MSRALNLLIAVCWAVVLGAMYVVASVGAILLLGRAMDNV